jgi:hypothetical protein
MFVGEPRGFTWLGHSLARDTHSSLLRTSKCTLHTSKILFYWSNIISNCGYSSGRKKSQIMAAIVVKNLINFYAFVQDKTVTLDVNMTF